eukprot:Cvel_25912.t1-p1 / transcript=Cvel_25912.t1 / gene=Cvel_25912 / organism=Chromera_velia_CCMP2878 / gene_product=hypothetical protein / transcript_product=hypothetical protein / location=Cvel_scaffold2994:20954-21554(+) / protein_length=143 / sequence_SO=supercontig / SO=protein_coding / is_pseudo=false
MVFRQGWGGGGALLRRGILLMLCLRILREDSFGGNETLKVPYRKSDGAGGTENLLQNLFSLSGFLGTGFDALGHAWKLGGCDNGGASGGVSSEGAGEVGNAAAIAEEEEDDDDDEEEEEEEGREGGGRGGFGSGLEDEEDCGG